MFKLNLLKDRLQQAERYYQASCYQLAVLNILMESLTKRYEIATKNSNRASRYSLRMRMAVAEGVRNMFYEYATNKACMINSIRQEIIVENSFLEDSSSEMHERSTDYDYPVFLSDEDTDYSSDEDPEDEAENSEVD